MGNICNYILAKIYALKTAKCPEISFVIKYPFLFLAINGCIEEYETNIIIIMLVKLSLPSLTTRPTLVLNFDFQSSGHPESRLGGHHHAHRHDRG